jgi:replicative superfamily II helicase
MKRLVYKSYAFNILEYLYTRTDSGWVPRKVLEKTLKIPPGSMSDVLRELADQGLVKRTTWWKNQEKVEITDSGREHFSSLSLQRPAFPIPPPVQQYLRSRFQKDINLFPIQQAFVDRGLIYSKNNVCVFGYPGSGKTLIAEMVMANDLQNDGKVLYATPYKALDWQKYTDFRNSFGDKFGRVVINDGDNLVQPDDLNQARIIIGTYERVYEGLKRNESWLNDVTTLVVDEISILGEDRGATLDLLLTEFAGKEGGPRIITLSSLVGNPLEISEWLRAEPVIVNKPAPGIKLSEFIVYRERKEMAMFLGRDGKRSEQVIQKSIMEDIVAKNLARNETTLIFEGSRGQTKRFAKGLKTLCTQDQDLVNLVREFVDKDRPIMTKLTKSLCKLIEYGIAFHNAGLQRKVRKFVERLMNENKLKVVVATTTLSHGIDYRIDNVIIDLASFLAVRKFEVQECEYINLKGRTGRPEKSKNANVYLMFLKEFSNKAFNKYFVGTPEPVYPQNTFDEEQLVNTILLQSTRNGISVESLMQIFNRTLAFQHAPVSRVKISKAISALVKSGLLKKKDSSYGLTMLGQRIVSIGLVPSEIKKINNLPNSATTAEIFEVATHIGLAWKVRKDRAFREDNAVNVLTQWIARKTLDEITEGCPGYEDQDVLDLVKYTVHSIAKMNQIVESGVLRRNIKSLTKRLQVQKC